MICDACPREARGFGWTDLKLPKAKQKTFHACSMACIDTIAKRNGKLDDMTKHEINAMYDASAAGGQYIESLGKTDMSAFSEDEWMSLVDALVTGYCDGMRSRTGISIRENDTVPF